MKKQTDAQPDVLLIDDGELDEVVRVLESENIDFLRLRGGAIPAEVAPPRELLIVTPRRLERVRRGSPTDASPGRPVRIIAVEEDSPAMRRRLRQAGLNLLVRQPADPEVWRLLIARALYDGSERREDPRVAVHSRVRLGDQSTTTLMDLSNRGCRLQTDRSFKEGDSIEFSIPPNGEDENQSESLHLSGEVRRIAQLHGSPLSTLAVVFDPDLPEDSRIKLTMLINRWASGMHCLDSTSASSPASAATASPNPAIPPCQLASLPDLTLDDETDPPVAAQSEVLVEMAESAGSRSAQAEGSRASDASPGIDRRKQQRALFETPIHAQTRCGPVVLIGQDLSAGGMRIERLESLELGDRFRLSLHGPGRTEAFIVDAEIIRDEGEAGFALRFDSLDPDTAAELDKLVACLPDVESLDAGEVSGMGAVLSEILVDED
ncbi:MAG TPA: PilZ domain-containing protein [Myxococcales bacterium]|nr:PilZ domain-containing protein [Myxococcales bacterium]HIL81361.1 PilZ domain-containing protein [Myxococcales bacterium]